ncbi:FecR domain-containing protein [Pseudomonas sp. PSKL.D1]|uniref:FecR domain-containing protein n=1 Tax=Pseudomonas sp. PSKL.D1 TaxID=3029060 RepID=UPI002380CC9A|nr:FecR domain-containing protein [Pseudomonas sp. PSKL.D1]WDY56027.1 FecR domain-containing protein [Pseudomonas sp. PSKL.D1]
MNTSPQRQALSAAAHWFARLGEAPQDPRLQQQWQAWHNADPHHQWAWQQVAMLQARMGKAQGALGYGVLERAGLQGMAHQRRMLLKGLVLGVGLGALGWRGYRDAPVWLADQRTAVGEQRRLTLNDGSQLILNTASAVDIAFTANARMLHLQAGEIYVETAHDPRPFLVSSAQGVTRALGTRFSVRQYEGVTRTSVFQDAVAIRPRGSQGDEQAINSGHSVTFDSQRVLQHAPLATTDDAWTEGRLVVDDWRLDRLIDELQRYRSGYLGCAANVGQLRVSGAYSLTDIDLTLATIARSLPVRLSRHTRFWTRLEAVESPV